VAASGCCCKNYKYYTMRGCKVANSCYFEQRSLQPRLQIDVKMPLENTKILWSRP
jgi:hypothetical protein